MKTIAAALVVLLTGGVAVQAGGGAQHTLSGLNATNADRTARINNLYAHTPQTPKDTQHYNDRINNLNTWYNTYLSRHPGLTN